MPQDTCKLLALRYGYRWNVYVLSGITVQKYTIHCPLMNTETLLYIQQHLWVLEVAMITKSWCAAAGSWSFTMLLKFYWKLLYRRDREQSLKIHTIVQSLIHIWTLLLAPEASNRGIPKLDFEVLRVCSIDQKPHPLWVDYTYSTSMSDYSCHQNIHPLLYASLVISKGLIEVWILSWASISGDRSLA